MSVRRKRNMKWTPERIKELRDAYGETQDEFRLRFPVGISTIRFWETQGSASPMGCTILDRLEQDLLSRQTA